MGVGVGVEEGEGEGEGEGERERRRGEGVGVGEGEGEGGWKMVPSVLLAAVDDSLPVHAEPMTHHRPGVCVRVCVCVCGGGGGGGGGEGEKFEGFSPLKQDLNIACPHVISVLNVICGL